MAEVTIKYKGSTIGEMSESTTKTLETAGTYCEGDITVTYDRPQTGAGTVIAVEDTLDENGGTIRTITAVSLEGDTVSPSSLLAGYTAHNSLGEPIVGTASGGSTTINPLSVTSNGTYTAPAGTAYSPVTVNVSATVNNQNKTKSYTPSETAQSETITADSGYSGLGEVTVNVGAISSTYVGSGVTRKGATTYNTSTSDQTIASGTYLTGAQTIKAVTTSNLSAANVKAGTTITVGDANDADRIASVAGTFTSDATATAAQINSGATAYVNGSKVTGTQVIQTYYTGTSAPSSSLGSNGDIYLKTV